MNTKFDELLTFPCSFSFKVIGDAEPVLVTKITDVLDQHISEYKKPSSKLSKNGNYQSVSVTIQAQSKEQLETLYKALGSIDTVRYVL